MSWVPGWMNYYILSCSFGLRAAFEGWLFFSAFLRPGQLWRFDDTKSMSGRLRSRISEDTEYQSELQPHVVGWHNRGWSGGQQVLHVEDVEALIQLTLKLMIVCLARVLAGDCMRHEHVPVSCACVHCSITFWTIVASIIEVRTLYVLG